MKTLKIIIHVGLLLLIGSLLGACKDETVSALNLDADVNVLGFKVAGVDGLIDKEASTITVMVPAGTDLSAISPMIELPAHASVVPASGDAQNFLFSATNPVVYRVYNGNVFQTYRVTVKEIKAEITAFRIGNHNGIINSNDRSIVIYLPEGTDITQLNPVVEYTDGAEISPAAGNYVDFSEPVTYTLNYVGETFAYRVTVKLGEEPKHPIVIFNGEHIAPQWADLGVKVDNQSSNPKTDGINTSPLCASILRDAVHGEGWHGGALWNENKVNIDPSAYTHFSLMILKDVAGDVQLEIQSDGESNKDWLRASYSEYHVGEWQELIFEIPANRTALINHILVMPHEHANGQPVPFETQRMYWDELKALPKE